MDRQAILTYEFSEFVLSVNQYQSWAFIEKKTTYHQELVTWTSNPGACLNIALFI